LWFSLDRITKKANLLYLGMFKVLMAFSKNRGLTNAKFIVRDDAKKFKK